MKGPFARNLPLHTHHTEFNTLDYWAYLLAPALAVEGAERGGNPLARVEALFLVRLADLLGTENPSSHFCEGVHSNC